MARFEIQLHDTVAPRRERDRRESHGSEAEYLIMHRLLQWDGIRKPSYSPRPSGAIWGIWHGILVHFCRDLCPCPVETSVSFIENKMKGFCRFYRAVSHASTNHLGTQPVANGQQLIASLPLPKRLPSPTGHRQPAIAGRRRGGAASMCDATRSSAGTAGKSPEPARRAVQTKRRADYLSSRSWARDHLPLNLCPRAGPLAPFRIPPLYFGHPPHVPRPCPSPPWRALLCASPANPHKTNALPDSHFQWKLLARQASHRRLLHACDERARAGGQGRGRATSTRRRHQWRRGRAWTLRPRVVHRLAEAREPSQGMQSHVGFVVSPRGGRI
mmetsp:Transcript_12370/g.31211  ORF Transcript_12370/g.31211 Transcript_12370/m.31211 type:complete len:329 (+) Transcript_12370:472-1458(+)